MARAKGKGGSPYNQRFLSGPDREDFTWYFDVGRHVENVATAPDLTKRKLKQAKGEPKTAARVHVKKGQPPDPWPANNAAIAALKHLNRAAQVERALRQLVADNPAPAYPGSKLRFTVGQEHFMVLHDAYVFPTTIMSDGNTVYLEGEREVWRLKSGHSMQWRNHRLVDRPDLVPGVEARWGKQRDEFSEELEAACRAYERAKAAAGVDTRPVQDRDDEPKPEPRLVTKAAAARILNRSRTQVQRMIVAGELSTKKHAGREMVLVEIDDRA